MLEIFQTRNIKYVIREEKIKVDSMHKDFKKEI